MKFARKVRLAWFLAAAFCSACFAAGVGAGTGADASAGEAARWRAEAEVEETGDVPGVEKCPGCVRVHRNPVEVCLGHLAEQIRSDGKLKASGQLGGRLDDAGATALGLLAFLGAGYTTKAGKFKDAVGASVAGIEKLLRADGRLADDLLNHALATLALSENWGMMRASAPEPAAKAVEFLAAQQTEDGGFPAKAGGKESDAIVTFLSVMAFRSAKIAGLKVENGTLQKLYGYIEKRIDSKTGLVLGADGKPDRTLIAGTAVALQMLGALPDDQRVTKLVDALLAEPPSHERPDFLAWYWSQLACFRVGGQRWQTWNEACKPCLREYRYLRIDAPAAGLTDEAKARLPKLVEAMRSEDFPTREAASREALSLPTGAADLLAPHLKDQDPEVAMRVECAIQELKSRAASDPYALAMLAMTLEVYYRYLPVYQP